MGEEEDDGSVDAFVFDTGHGKDIIYYFVDNQNKIDVSAFNLSGFADLSLSVDDNPGGSLVSVGNEPDPVETLISTGTSVVIDLTTHGGGTIQLVDFDIANLDESDFLF